MHADSKRLGCMEIILIKDVFSPSAKDSFELQKDSEGFVCLVVLSRSHDHLLFVGSYIIYK